MTAASTPTQRVTSTTEPSTRFPAEACVWLEQLVQDGTQGNSTNRFWSWRRHSRDSSHAVNGARGERHELVDIRERKPAYRQGRSEIAKSELRELTNALGLGIPEISVISLRALVAKVMN